MTKLFKTLVASIALAGAILLSVPTIARAACCKSGDGWVCCGCRCSADATSCESGPCAQ